MSHELQNDAYQAGLDAGRARGSWVLDGNSTVETARAILAGIEEGDPMVLDMMPAPLSGEWAGESIPELSDAYGVDLADEENADAFEQGYSEGYWGTVQSAALAMVEDGDDDMTDEAIVAQLRAVGNHAAADLVERG